jgi:hypothetical protein
MREEIYEKVAARQAKSPRKSRKIVYETTTVLPYETEDRRESKISVDEDKEEVLD